MLRLSPFLILINLCSIFFTLIRLCVNNISSLLYSRAHIILFISQFFLYTFYKYYMIRI